jgi:hypothetical protein
MRVSGMVSRMVSREAVRKVERTAKRTAGRTMGRKTSSTSCRDARRRTNNMLCGKGLVERGRTAPHPFLEQAMLKLL